MAKKTTKLVLSLRAIIYLVFVFTNSSAYSKVDIPVCSTSCTVDQICIRKEANKPAVCQVPPSMSPIKDLALPFSPKEEVFCTHSSGSGSHSWTNAYYALDLATDYEKSAATINAAADGKAFVFLGEEGKPCTEPAGNPAQTHPSTCGLSWGNRVKILHEGGYYTFYVHLDRVLIENGTLVKKGQPIGIEGWTGAAGHRHLHWSVQKLPGVNVSDWEKRISWDGESVPFQFRAYLNGKLTTVDTSNFSCAHANIGQVSPSQQPKLRAVEQ
ncbi:MAG: M23 family metallopeptidase [Bdellovibrionaceae bacterium]|nr:M23 family metallopeptidase [Pseudobdellovibrionaceae bacterium]